MKRGEIDRKKNESKQEETKTKQNEEDGSQIRGNELGGREGGRGGEIIRLIGRIERKTETMQGERTWRKKRKK